MIERENFCCIYLQVTGIWPSLRLSLIRSTIQVGNSVSIVEGSQITVVLPGSSSWTHSIPETDLSLYTAIKLLIMHVHNCHGSITAISTMSKSETLGDSTTCDWLCMR